MDTLSILIKKKNDLTYPKAVEVYLNDEYHGWYRSLSEALEKIRIDFNFYVAGWDKQ